MVDIIENIRLAIYDAINEYVDISEQATIQELNETLLHSFDANVVIKALSIKYKLANSNRDYQRNKRSYKGIICKRNGKNHCDVILLCISKTEDIELLKSITCEMERLYGWFLATPLDIKPFDDDFDGWQFEKKIDIDVTHIVKSKQHLYSLVPTSRLSKILHVGLQPRRTSWEAYTLDDTHTFSLNDHDRHYGWKTIERVYMFLDKPEGDFLKNNRFDEKDIVTDTYTLLEIDVVNLKDDIKYYYDPRYENAVYTTTNIHASALKLCDC